MPRPSAVVTEAELSVLNFLWEHGASVAREITIGLYREHTAAYHATVNSLLDQLEKKQYVTRDRSGFAHRFDASVKREDVVATQLQELADSHFGGALAPMLLPLVDSIKLSSKDRAALKKIIDRAR